MIRSAVGILIVAAASLLVPGAVKAQAPEAAANIPAEANAWLQEIQQIHLQLAELQERALQDSELAARRDLLGNNIRTAMESIDPSLVQRMSRIEEMERQAAEAEAQNDEATLIELRAEAQQIEQQFLAVQQQALQRPELAAEVTAFQTALEAKILQTDPNAPQLLARFQELEQKLAELANR